MKNQASKEFMELAGSAQLAEKNLHYSYLTAYGKKELEFMLMYMHQYHGVQRIEFLGHLANILLIYMPACEVM